MSDEIRIQELLDNLESHQTPEDVCGNDVELLREVRARWEKMGRLKNQIDDLFPHSEKDAPTWKAAPGSAPELPQIDGYDVESVLGRGGMGVVFKAKHRKLNRYVALKMMLAGPFAGSLERARFQREANAVAALRHPNIVQIHDFGDLSAMGGTGRHYFTMEFVEGGSLSQKLAGKVQAAPLAARMIATLAVAVQFAHKSGFIHRDIKPANILLTSDGVPKITDFGLARSIEAGPEFTLSGARVGTPSYMAPEQALGKAHAIGPAVDIYALGAVLYEMLTGRPPFQGESAAATERQVIADEPAPPSRLNSKVPRDLETICLKCLQKDPSRRYASAQDLADDLHRFLDGKPVLARPVGVVERTVKWARRRPTLATLIVLFAAAIGTGLWLYQHENSRQADTAQRRSKARQAIEAGIDQAYVSARKERLQEASLLLAEVENHLPNADSDELRARLEQAHAEVKFAQQRMEIREAAALSDAEQFEVNKEKAFELLATGYQKAFQQAGFNLDEDPANTAAKIRASLLGELTLTALDEWALATFMLQREDEQRKLLLIARLADPGPHWRDRFRDPAAWRDKDKLRTLAKDALAAATPPPTHQLVITATLLRKLGATSEGMALLHEAVRRHPSDYWLNWEIAYAYLQDNQSKDSVPFFRVLVALRPNRPWPINRLGCVLVLAGASDDGLAHIRAAIQLEPKHVQLRRNLVLALIQAGRMEDAIAESEKILTAEPGNAEAAFTFGLALSLKKRYKEAIEMYRKAVDVDPSSAVFSYNLGEALRLSRRFEEAAAAFRTSLDLDGNDIHGHIGLCLVLFELRRYQEAIPECEWVIRNFDPKKKIKSADIGDGLDSRYIVARHLYAESLFCEGRFAEAGAAATAYFGLPTAHISEPVLKSLRAQRALCERLLPLESNLDAILAGAELRSNPAVVADLAEWCCKYRRLPLTSVRLYEDAFMKQKRLADDPNARHRFHAACAAALAASGSATESAKLDDGARAALRQKAFAWLRADGSAWVKRNKEGKSGDLPGQTVRVWQECKELASVRDEAALAKLPEEERRNWRNLWAEMNTLTLRNAESYVRQGRVHIDRKEWPEAAACYAQLKHVALTDEPWFEHTAVLLLAGDHDGYVQNCKRTLGDMKMRDFLVARACTLSPKTPLDIVLAADARAGELRSNEKAFWSLTARGALSFRKSRAKEAVALFQRSVVAEPKPGAAVVNWLWLALAHQKLGNTDEARFWLNKAGKWLDSVGKELPANADSFALHRHNWLEAQILRREAEALIPQH